MAQYTPALASEFNTLQNQVKKVIGTGDGNRNYGLGATVYSSTVTVGQTISPTEFVNLRYDINTAYFYQTGSTATLGSIVSGQTITWANFVSYQNAANYIDTNVVNGYTYYDSDYGKFGGYPHLSYIYSGDKVLNSGWGGGLNGNTGGQNVIRTAVQFSSDAELRYFFNAGGRITANLTLSGGSPSSSPINKDYAYQQLINAGYTYTYTKGTWWANSGSGGPGSGSNYSATYDTANITALDGTIYETANHNLTLSRTISYVNSGEIRFETIITDYDQFTTNNAGAPWINFTTTYYLAIAYPTGATPTVGGTQVGDAISKTPPTVGGWSSSPGYNGEWYKVY